MFLHNLARAVVGTAGHTVLADICTLRYAPLLAAGCLGLGAPLAAGAWLRWRGKEGPRLPGWLFFAFGLPAAATLLLGVAGGVRLLGRHFMPAFPLLLLMISALLLPLWRRRKWRWLALLFLAAWLGSAARLRWSADYGRDDYRAAAAVARELAGAEL